MKILKYFLIFIMTICTFTILSSCAAKALEKEINVVFMCDGEYIGSGTVTQFKNIKTPTLPDGYVPENYKFFGWTPRPLNSVKPTDENFKSEYIGDGKMVHYMDVKDYVDNFTVICQAVMFDINDIPKVYHYVAIAWYDKVATSGLNEDLMKTFTTKLNAYLSSEGVTQEDLDTIVIRGYTGQVGQSCGAIMSDGDIDIMLGWSSRSNVINTGGMKDEMLLETVDDFTVGSHTRTIHRLSDSETVIKVMEWMKSAECRNIFK